MINSVNVPEQPVLAGTNVLFNIDRIKTKSCQCGGWLQHDAGSGLFTISKPGIYQIEFNANLTSAVIGVLSLDIEANGEAIGGTKMIHTLAVANSYENISASTLVCVPCGASKTISVGNNTVFNELVKDANIIITRLS